MKRHGGQALSKIRAVATLFDLMGAYDTGRWRFSANAANLGDKTHVTACLARGDCFYGMRRTVVITLGYRF